MCPCKYNVEVENWLLRRSSDDVGVPRGKAGFDFDEYPPHCGIIPPVIVVFPAANVV